jgi:hypothetical protein
MARDLQIQVPAVCHLSWTLRMLRITVIVFALLTFLSACDKSEPQRAQTSQPSEASAQETKAPKPTIDIDDPESCKGCHGAIYREWTESMHSRAHHDEDPIYGAMRAFRMKKQGEQIAGQCAKCHNPRSPEAPDAPAGRAGVSCATCHNVSKVHIEQGRVGVDALTWAEGDVMRSGRDLEPGASPVHGTGPALPAMKDGKTLCLSCHNATSTPGGAPACTTGPEHSEYRGDQTCVSCHMPEVEGAAGAVGRQERHISHKFLGPHRAWYQDDSSFLESAVDLSAEFANGGLEVTLANKSAHGFPSGFPGRLVVVQVVGKDAAGAVTWKNFDQQPMAEHPDSVLNKVYHDAEGKSVPAPFSVKMVRDTRLETDETRVITYDVPAEVRRVEVSLIYRLLPPKLAGVLGIADRIEATPRVIATTNANR